MALSSITSKVWGHLWTLYIKYGQDAGPIYSAAIAYAALFSLFPLALLGISLAGFAIASPESQEQVIQIALATLPAGLGDTIRGNINDIVGGRGLSGIVAAIGLLVSAIGVFGTLEFSLNRMLHAESARGPLGSVIRHIAMVFIIFLLFLFSLALSWFRHIISANAQENALGSGFYSWMYDLSSTLAAISVSMILFMIIFVFVPNTRLRFREVWMVSLFGASLLELAKYLFGLYLVSLARYNVVYGSIGAVIALLTWIYISATILLLCAEIISVNKEKSGNIMEKQHTGEKPG